MKFLYLLSLSVLLCSSHLFAGKSDASLQKPEVAVSEGEWFTWTHVVEAASVVAPAIGAVGFRQYAVELENTAEAAWLAADEKQVQAEAALNVRNITSDQFNEVQWKEKSEQAAESWKET